MLYVDRCIQVAIMYYTTSRANPASYAEVERLEKEPTSRARLA